MAYKYIEEKVRAAGNRERRRKLMKQLGLFKGATKKRTASLKVKR
jgi:hypothetical protein